MCALPTRVDQIGGDDRVDAVVVAMDGQGPLELLGAVHAKAPEAAVVVVTEADHEADGAVAMHAGAEDHLVRRVDPTRAAASVGAVRGVDPPAAARARRRPTR